MGQEKYRGKYAQSTIHTYVKFSKISQATIKKYFNEEISQDVWGMTDKQVKYLHYYPKRKKEV